MRFVLKNGAEVFHYWANQVQSQGRASNVSFKGPEAYSYARMIAKIHAKQDGSKLVLFGTTGRSSVMTSKHISMARSAASHLPQIEVPSCDPRSVSDHISNLQAIARNIIGSQGMAARALKGWSIDRWHEQALRLMRAYDDYAMFFDRPERYSPEALAELAESVRKQQAAAKAEDKRRQKERDEQLKEKLAQWRQGEMYVPLWDLSFVALRLGASRGGTNYSGGLLPDRGSEGIEVVQTSRGAEIPVKDAIRLWPMILKAKAEGKEWNPVVALGPYRLNKINADGSIVVGCHNIGFNEIEGIAHQLGLTDTSEAKSGV